MSEIKALLNALEAGRSISPEGLRLAFAEMEMDAVDVATLLKSNRELQAELFKKDEEIAQLKKQHAHELDKSFGATAAARIERDQLKTLLESFTKELVLMRELYIDDNNSTVK